MTALLLLTALISDGSWPQFRGPAGLGVVDTELPVEWSDTENVTWSCDLPGLGHSSPVVYDTMVWMTTAAEDGSAMSLLGVDLESGRLVHNIGLFRPTDIKEIHAGNSYASPTPCVDGDHVYVHFGRYGTAAVDTSTGEVVWKNESVKVWHNSGPASSAVLAGGRLILVFDAMEESFVCGLDPATGEMAWKTPRSAPMRDNPIMHRAFSTPLVLDRDGRDVIVVPGPDQMNCYVAATGEELWHTRYTGFSTVPCPTTDGDHLFYMTGFFDAELTCLDLTGLFGDDAATGDVTKSNVLWRYTKATPDTPSPTYHEGKVWIVSDKGVLSSVGATTGERISVDRVRDNVNASPLIAGNHLYVFGESGKTTVWDIRERQPKLVATNALDSPIKASPAVVGDSLLVRTTKSVVRITRD